MIQKCPYCCLQFYNTSNLHNSCPNCRTSLLDDIYPDILQRPQKLSLSSLGGIGDASLSSLGGLKYDQQKPRMDLISSIALIELAKVLEYGSRKYDAHNWRKGIAYSRLIGAALRHMFSYLSGESKDPETGLSHMAHAMCNIMFLLEFEATKPELDDRYKPEATKINKA